MNVHDVFRSAVQDLPRLFKKNELAYLSLSSKSENPVRDRLAFRMHLRGQTEGLIVAREWNHRDIAILSSSRSEDACLGLMELKMMFSFDASSISPTRSRYVDLTRMDVEKAMKKAIEKASHKVEIYSLLLITHPLTCPPDSFQGANKYWKDITRSLKSPRTAEITWQETTDYLEKNFPEDVPKATARWRAGEAFGVTVDIGYWLLGPWKSL